MHNYIKSTLSMSPVMPVLTINNIDNVEDTEDVDEDDNDDNNYCNFDDDNLIFFWLIPSVFASIQLFFYGTYLVHEKDGIIKNSNLPKLSSPL